MSHRRINKTQCVILFYLLYSATRSSGNTISIIHFIMSVYLGETGRRIKYNVYILELFFIHLFLYVDLIIN